MRLLLQPRDALGRQAPQLGDEPVQEGLVSEVRLRTHLRAKSDKHCCSLEPLHACLGHPRHTEYACSKAGDLGHSQKAGGPV